MKRNRSYLRQYLPWLGLLLGVDAEHVLFDEGKTMFFEERNGAIALTHTCPQVGGLYDGSDI